jgi:arsenate reductase
MSRRRNVLFLCTGNSARSILAEALLERLGSGRYRAYSAGSRPQGHVHPMALELLREEGHATRGLRSKSWDEFARPVAPVIDFVFSVCDAAARESCPVWPGHPVTAHWGLEDPAAFRGPEPDQRAVFRRVYRELERRIEAFVRLDTAGLSASCLQARLDAIGRRPADPLESP